MPGSPWDALLAVVDRLCRVLPAPRPPAGPFPAVAARAHRLALVPETPPWRGWGLHRRLHSAHPHLSRRVIRAAITAARAVSAGLGVHNAAVVERLARARLTHPGPPPRTPTGRGRRDG